MSFSPALVGVPWFFLLAQIDQFQSLIKKRQLRKLLVVFWARWIVGVQLLMQHLKQLEQLVVKLLLTCSFDILDQGFDQRKKLRLLTISSAQGYLRNQVLRLI
jgi:thiol-disulfide isomerase/thioredoxin